MLILIETDFGRADRAEFEALEAVRNLAPDSAVVLVQNGVRRALNPDSLLENLLSAGVRVLVDEFSLSLRGLPHELLCPGVEVVEMRDVVDLLSQPRARALWH